MDEQDNGNDDHSAFLRHLESVVEWEECECRRPERGDQYCPKCIGNFLVQVCGANPSCQTCGGVGCIERDGEHGKFTDECPACFPPAEEAEGKKPD
jgi:hypothetical protein